MDNKQSGLLYNKLLMKTYHGLYKKVCSYENLELAFKKARKRKTRKSYVVEFEKSLKENLILLRIELLLHSYRPLPLRDKIINEPRTRRISISNFRDRVVHHAICNIIEPIFDKRFIADSFANRKGKGTLAAMKRLNCFMDKVSKNNTAVHKFGGNNIRGFFFKGDIKKYFDNVSHEKLMQIISLTINDKELLFLIRKILENHTAKKDGCGMPLGNLTSQFFANVYLNELDLFVKHDLKAKHYIRYVDDFVILHNNFELLEDFKERIDYFLKEKLLIELNHDKSKIIPLSRGIEFLGYRNYAYHKLLRMRNLRRAYQKIEEHKKECIETNISYDKAYASMEGWLAYAKKADTYKLRRKITQHFAKAFPDKIADVEIYRWLKLMKTYLINHNSSHFNIAAESQHL